MENMNQLRGEFEKSFAGLRNLIDTSFQMMEKNPQLKDPIIEMWKDSVQNFSAYAVHSSEKYNNREVYKAIAKTLIFGK
ncbi:hypothetical protein [Anaerosolibacter sp.]|uniref:hypothetical protein n=1 Tax=Anaerosolibacter sp. TaxID=1872527 RepID=UPI0039EF47A2